MKKLKNIFITLILSVFCSAAFAINPLISKTSITNEPLPPSVAFEPSITSDFVDTFNLNFNIKEGYHLYKDKISIKPSDDINIVSSQFPQGIKDDDPNFGEVFIYKTPIYITYKTNNKVLDSYKVEVTYQGCADIGVCYPPQTELILVKPSSNLLSINIESQKDEKVEHEVIAEKLKNDSIAVNILLFFIAGIGLSLTPCMLPMVPIISTVILGKHSKDNPLTHKRGLFLSMSYVLGMSLTYASAGVFAGYSGTLLTSILQNPYVLVFFALIFVILSGGMLGLYEIQLPSSIQEYFAKKSNKVKGKSFLSVFILGSISSLIVGPCVAAPLAGALLYIGQTGNAILGGVLLFSMSLGMGIPLLIVGTSSGSFAIKTGNWMEEIKRFFGFILLATSVWIVNPIIGDRYTMLVFGIILLYLSYDLKLYQSLSKKITKFQQFAKVLGFFCMIIGTSYIVGALGGSRSFIQPLSVYTKTSAHKELDFKVVKNINELNKILASSDKPIFLDFYANWCTSCKEFDKDVLSDNIVTSKLQNFTLIRADVTDTNEGTKELLKKFDLFGPPAFIFYDKGGVLLSNFTKVGSFERTDFLKTLDKITTKQPF